MNLFKYIFPLLFCFVFSILIPCYAQGVYQDAELWSEITLKSEINKKLGFDFTPSLRLNENLSEFKLFYLQGLLSYDLAKWSNLKLGYRFVLKSEDQNDAQRIFLDWSTKERFKPINLKNRVRFQIDEEILEGWKYSEVLAREKFSISYQRKKKHKLVPEIGGEIFYNVTDKSFEKYRIFSALAYDMKKGQEISLKYIFQRSLNDSRVFQSHIWGVAYSVRIKKKKKIQNKAE